jgi:hypothetical protein
MYVTFIFILGFLLGAFLTFRQCRLTVSEWAAVKEVRRLRGHQYVHSHNELRVAEQESKNRAREVLESEDRKRINNNEWPIYCLDCIKSYPKTLCQRHMTYLMSSMNVMPQQHSNDEIVELWGEEGVFHRRLSSNFPIEDISGIVYVEKIEDGTVR